jgi:hypothetical protein
VAFLALEKLERRPENKVKNKFSNHKEIWFCEISTNLFGKF